MPSNNEPTLAGGALLSAAQIQSAIEYNQRRWTGVHRGQILAKLRGGPGGEAFEALDVLRVAALQKANGAAAELVDGKIGPRTMAILLRTGLALSVSPGMVSPAQVRLVCYPGEFEDLAAWQAVRAAVGMQGQEGEHRAVSAKAPPGYGVIYVELGGNVVERMAARGGPVWLRSRTTGFPIHVRISISIAT